MKNIRLGILGPSEIAFRRFLPALKADAKFEYIGVAIAHASERAIKNDSQIDPSLQEKSKLKAQYFQNEFGGSIFESYEELLSSDKIDAIYIPLPPALHFNWAKKALEYGKHVLLEKPFTTNLADTNRLIKMAKDKNLALHENYAFCYHKQIAQILQMLNNGDIGELRLIRAAFGFPYRGASDFRYDKNMGGGALMDCGGYLIKIAALFLGKSVKITTVSLKTANGHEVDIYGSATLVNDEEITCQVAFGMDNSYKCELEIWGSEGCIYAPRIFTAPANHTATLVLTKQEETDLKVSPDDQFLGSIKYFHNCIWNNDLRTKTYSEIEQQSKLVDDFQKMIVRRNI